jgi:DNA-directed RNA polymerase specialized sigma24 family protein
MITCRSIPAATWAHAYDALVFYFSRRHGADRAQDLAQDTLTTVWTREDFEFGQEEDFLKVCYGFAVRISLAGFREARRNATEELNPDLEPPSGGGSGLNAAEMRLMLEEVMRAGEVHLKARDWEAIRQAAVAGRRSVSGLGEAADANYFRVRLHRARRKLAKITGWAG